jgi:hypothetical protein
VSKQVPNFIRLDPGRPDVAVLIDAMLGVWDSFFVAVRVLRGFLGDVRSAPGEICVFFATIPVFLESVTVQGGFFAAMSRNDNSGGYGWSRSNQRE